MNSKAIWIIVGIVLALICCCGAVGTFGLYKYIESEGLFSSTSIENLLTPTEAATESTSGMKIPPEGSTVDKAALETKSTLDTSLVPNNDLRELASRLKGIKNIPETIGAPVPTYEIGDSKEFNALNTDTNENFKVNTKLVYATDHAYFWIEDGVDYDTEKVKELGDIFENQIYPTDREFFGSEWTPGVDGDVHLYIIYAKGLGENIAGLFSSIDSINPLARPDSNGHESFFMSADNLNFGEEDKGTLAHEFQHMIHWYRDRNEDTWMNEGFSVLAEFLNHFDTGGFDELYTMNPDQQLTDWPDDNTKTKPHYGESFLFLDYFLDRFGENATKKLVAEPENGMVSIDKVLKDTNTTDPITGKLITADDVYADWVVAMFLKDGKAGDGRFQYKNYPNSPQPDTTETVSTCPKAAFERSVSQYGVDYIGIKCKGDYQLNFQGVLETGVFAENPHSGKFGFWSNKGDESDMTLTQTFDFSKQNSKLTLEYWTWYDLETDYDYAYLEYSEDGSSWTIMPTVSCTSENKSGNSYGCGWNGKSGGWKKESVDLSFLAGKKVQLRFEYITDAAVNGEGMILDDISIPEINYKTDFETDNGGWEPAGFVRIQNMLPQTYKVSLIQYGSPTSVTYIELDGRNHAVVPLSIKDTKGAVLVVSGTTRLSRQKALYQITITK
jgi:immune inhibitor A